MNNLTQVIAAVSTPPGKGGVAIIRVSGEDAVEIAKKVFFPRSKKSLTDYPKRTQIYGDIRYGEECIDDGMATCFFAPESYTGEDVVEISCHGGVLVTKQVLRAVLQSGAKPAEAGEFTKRAFLNGKMSITQAEAVMEMINATSNQALNAAKSALEGHLFVFLFWLHWVFEEDS